MLRAVMLAVVLAPVIARAQDAVALLPLDAEARLEILGQPVARKLSDALVAGGIDVVVVGPKMAGPDRARLIVGGPNAPGQGEADPPAGPIPGPAAGARRRP